jgi:hypothetical protein
MPQRCLAFTLVLLALALVVPAATGANAPGPGPDGEYDWPGMKKCGSFRADGFRIYVYANKHVRCRTARQVQKAYWRGEPGTDVIAHGDGPEQYSTLRAFPGWRCDSGSGGGGCRKGRRFAGYQN